MDIKFNSRKFLFALGLFIVGTVALFTGFAQFDQFSLYMLGVFGVYTGGNGAAKTKENTYD